MEHSKYPTLGHCPPKIRNLLQLIVISLDSHCTGLLRWLIPVFEGFTSSALDAIRRTGHDGYKPVAFAATVNKSFFFGLSFFILSLERPPLPLTRWETSTIRLWCRITLNRLALGHKRWVPPRHPVRLNSSDDTRTRRSVCFCYSTRFKKVTTTNSRHPQVQLNINGTWGKPARPRVRCCLRMPNK